MNHQDTIHDQFTRQAVVFSEARSMQDADAIKLLIQAARAEATHRSLDVACGPGLVALAFARTVQSAVGMDTTQAMLDRARALQEQQHVENIEWVLGDAADLPFPDESFDITTCRFAFHHMLRPRDTLAEMRRVTRRGGRIVVCDAVASTDDSKAAAFNAFEKMRDPSTVRFLTAVELRSIFDDVGVKIKEEAGYLVPVELEGLLKTSFPAEDDIPKLRRIVADSVVDNVLDMNTREQGGRFLLDYSALILSARRP